MFGAALDWVVRWRISGLSRAGQRDNNDPGLVLDVYRYFRSGITAGLAGWDGPRLAALEAAVPGHRRLFFWEGFGFGACCRHACLRRPGNPFGRYRAPGFRFMFWTGMGFWNGAAKPMPAVSLDPALWQQVPEFLDEYPLILGGTAFAVIAQQAEVDKHRLEAIAGIRDTADLDGVYMGAGRALWFLYTHNPAKLAAVLDAHPDHAEFMARGLGVAITLTQLATPERIVPAIASLPSAYWSTLLTGVYMAFTCLLMDDPRAGDIVAGCPQPLDVLLADTRANLPSFVGPGWTERMAESCLRHVALWDGLQPPDAAAPAPLEPVAAK